MGLGAFISPSTRLPCMCASRTWLGSGLGLGLGFTVFDCRCESTESRLSRPCRYYHYYYLLALRTVRLRMST